MPFNPASLYPSGYLISLPAAQILLAPAPAVACGKHAQTFSHRQLQKVKPRLAVPRVCLTLQYPLPAQSAPFVNALRESRVNYAMFRGSNVLIAAMIAPKVNYCPRAITTINWLQRSEFQVKAVASSFRVSCQCIVKYGKCMLCVVK